MLTAELANVSCCVEPVNHEIELAQTSCNGRGLLVLPAHEKQVAAVIVHKCLELRQPMGQNRCEMVPLRQTFGANELMQVNHESWQLNTEYDEHKMLGNCVVMA